MAQRTEVTEITVTVYHPRKKEPRTYNWPWTMKVGDAATEAARDFGAPNPDAASFMDQDHEEVMNRDKTLRGAHVEDGDELELTDTTGGVRGT